ncbi:CPBP family intramembrane metalloprotease [Paenibacillus alvei]|uniref:CPBP family intramembrane metalloprotease n=1 Tax=Paenibacillus alvei TaxID=44250 RepID=A0ABT4EIY9_PAEAL|nr:type II CAAX endopeptidase family protein [Paenibacillus alvei]MCY9532398.1 CPBP family intramembrane metalloprotease [Paenibacillus alvei]
MKTEFSIRHPYWAAILVGLLCTLMTATGFAVTKAIGLDDDHSLLVLAAFLAVSAIIGFMIMKKSRFSLYDYGFRYSEAKSSSKVMFYIPLLVIEVLSIVAYGFSGEIRPVQYVFTLLFTISIGFNEEIYFRGLALRYIGEKGIKAAIIWSSVIFGVLHMANAFGGQNIGYSLLQVVYAFLIGIVFAEIVSITKSLWFVIVWHAAHDFISLLTEGSIETGIIILPVQVALLLFYAIYLWKKHIAQESSITNSTDQQPQMSQ